MAKTTNTVVHPMPRMNTKFITFISSHKSLANALANHPSVHSILKL